MTDKKERPKRQDFSPLDAHHRRGKVFTPPLMRVSDNIELHSWHSERLPETLWAVLLSATLPRADSLQLLSAVAKAAMQFREHPEVFPAHSALAGISKEQFAALFADVLKDKSACSALSPLLLLDSLPDRAHWAAHLPTSVVEEGWNAMAEAVAACLDPRSRPAIDVRWLRVMFLGLQHRLMIKKEDDEIVDMLCAYPTGKDVPDWADAMIGSMEPMVGIGFDGAARPNWSEDFWRDCLKGTPCVVARYMPPVPEAEFPYEEAKTRWGQIYAGLMKHFFQTLRNTGIDARHDAVFGLALYAMSLVTGMMRPHSTRPSGRHLLRSLAEANITLAYLVFRDDPEIWKMYRAYGTGQAKLAFLKLVETEREDLPRHVDVALLERLANEDMWQEYVSIDVGHWAGLTARKMADDAGVKDVYDKFYVWPSGFVHGQWAAVRDSVFDLCANPLHRFHRVPRPMRVDMPDVCFDAVRLMNRILGLVDQAFPSFALRFDETSHSARATAPTAASE